MSVEAITWAYGQKMKSSVKFVLITLCNYADAECRLWPSVANLVEKTCLDRKTVLAAIAVLEEMGYLIDTGERKGQTRQIKVYRIDMNSTENGTVPNFPSKSTVFLMKESQISVERVPKTGHRTIIEPSINHQGNRQYAPAREAPPSPKPKPEKPEKFSPVDYLTAKGVDTEVAGDWLAMRKAKKAQPTKTAIDGIAGEAAKAGISLEDALKISCANGWQGFRADWITQRRNGKSPVNCYDHNMAVVANFAKTLRGENHG